MAGFIDLKTTVFFDSPAVSGALSRSKERGLRTMGVRLRFKAQGQLKRKGKSEATRVSKPGESPRVKKGSPLKRRLFFAFDPVSQTVVVGPEGFRGSNVPGALEYGGTTTAARLQRGRNGRRKVVRVQQRIAPRPFMAPALEKAQADDRFRNAMKDTFR